jgi:hypothetical protein
MQELEPGIPLPVADTHEGIRYWVVCTKRGQNERAIHGPFATYGKAYSFAEANAKDSNYSIDQDSLTITRERII